MPLYRCFFKTEEGRIAQVEELEAPGDEYAVARCLERLKTAPGWRGIELWEFERLVHRLP